jgi:hypothetical protein
VTQPRNIAASVRARLTQRARANKENVQLVLTRYAIERLLYRLGRSAHRDRFVLKGAMLFSLWTDVPYRATGDLDLLGFGASDVATIARIFRSICEIATPEDGVHFAADTLRAEAAREEDEYQGVRVTVEAVIAGARLPIQVDIGFGDVVTPAAQEIDYPPLLEFPAPRLRAYPPETVVAEKFQALVALGMLNSRMKDFYDLWAIAQTFRFEGVVLAEAIRATFERRATAVPVEVPIALTPAFAEDPLKQSQWQGFLRRTAIVMAPAPLDVILQKIDGFVMPPTRSIAQQAPFDRWWAPGGPWMAERDPAAR